MERLAQGQPLLNVVGYLGVGEEGPRALSNIFVPCIAKQFELGVIDPLDDTVRTLPAQANRSIVEKVRQQDRGALVLK